MGPFHFLDGIASRWASFTGERRETLLLVSLLFSSLVALLPFARDASMSNFFIYALLPIILVFANREKFRALHTPSGTDFVLALLLIIGSFVFNSVTGLFTNDFVYGLTDYVILIAGIFSAFYSIREPLTQAGILLMVILRGATLATSIAYSSAFASVSDFFVSIVVILSRWLVSPSVAAGTVPGEIYVGGEAGTSTVFIGWACAGLEELVLISVILYVLIASFHITGRRTAAWLSVGIAGSFIVNIVRMVMLVWVAHEYGLDRMMWVHTHLGDVLFLAWIAVFWMVFFRFGLQRTSVTGGARPPRV